MIDSGKDNIPGIMANGIDCDPTALSIVRAPGDLQVYRIQ